MCTATRAASSSSQAQPEAELKLWLAAWFRWSDSRKEHTASWGACVCVASNMTVSCRVLGLTDFEPCMWQPLATPLPNASQVWYVVR